MKKSKILLAPHNDDEALFVSYTIMREKPLVLIVTSSHVQYLRGDGITAGQRRLETQRAMKKLGVEIYFLNIPDDNITKEILTTTLNAIPYGNIRNAQVVFAPMIEGGNRVHDIVGEVAHEMFSNVLHYSTYTKTRPYPLGDIEIYPTQKERKLKNEILEEYHTQKNHRFNKVYFEFARKRNEYFNSSRLIGQLELKEHTLRNLVDTKKALDSLGIPFCLMDGTLLGAYRDRDFIPGDYDDTDIGFDVKYRDQIPSIFQRLNEFGLRTFKVWGLREQFEGGAVARGGNHVDILCIHKRGKDAYNLGRNFLPNNPREYMAYVYPAECFERFDKLIFKGMEFNIPCKVETFLKARYGDWKTPLRRGEGFDWLNIEQNPALTADYEIGGVTE